MWLNTLNRSRIRFWFGLICIISQVDTILLSPRGSLGTYGEKSNCVYAKLWNLTWLLIYLVESHVFRVEIKFICLISKYRFYWFQVNPHSLQDGWCGSLSWNVVEPWMVDVGGADLSKYFGWLKVVVACTLCTNILVFITFRSFDVVACLHWGWLTRPGFSARHTRHLPRAAIFQGAANLEKK